MRSAILISSIGIHLGLLGAGAWLAVGSLAPPATPPLLIGLQVAPASALATPPPPPSEPLVLREDAEEPPPEVDLREPEPRSFERPDPVWPGAVLEQHERAPTVPEADVVIAPAHPQEPPRTELPPPEPQTTSEHEPAETARPESPEPTLDVTEPTDQVEQSAPPAAEITAPREIEGQNPTPDYPPLARKRGWEGEVTFLLEIDEHGSVTAARIEKSTGHTILDRAAERSVRSWRFAPATTNGIATCSEHRVTVAFEIE